MSLVFRVLLLGSFSILSLHARLNSHSKLNAESTSTSSDESSFSPRRLQYSEDQSRYMVWDFSENIIPKTISGVRANEMFGSSVAIWDQYMVIGASGDRSREFASGATYVYSKELNSDGTYYWVYVEVLEPWDGAEGDNFGCAVDLHLYTLVIGANMHDEGGQDTGAAYLYECYNNAHHHQEDHGRKDEEMQRRWYLAAKLQPEGGSPQDYFGSTVATQGNFTAVGAYGSDVMATFSGAVYIWRKTWHQDDPHHPWEWIYDEVITPSDGQRYDYFSSSIAISGTTLVVGATGVDEGETYKAGAVYVFLNTYDDSADDGLSYQLLSKLTPGSSGVIYENFGQSVAIWGDNLIVGAPNALAGGEAAAGAFYSYGFDQYSKPYFIERVEPQFPTAGAHCGYSIDLYRDLAAVGCPNATGHGSVYVYTEVSPLTTPSTKNIHWLYEAQKQVGDKVKNMYGHTVSVYDDTVAVGAYMAMNAVGTAYMYTGRKKIYQDLFVNETDDGVVGTDDDEVDFIEEIEDAFVAFEEAHPQETKLIVLMLFLVVLTGVTLLDRRRRESLEENAKNNRQKAQYELANMDSSHTGSSYEASERRNASISSSIRAGESSHSSATYSPAATTTSRGPSQRVRDLAAAGLMAKSSQKYTPLVSSTRNPVRGSSDSPAPDAGQ
mmetsp:Transcript_18771/g.31290  ORF Transcript_18771/g.31290 Transcript_18771/m.31290 type:complete len:665 (+) Transcript_18771:29-2023(+)